MSVVKFSISISPELHSALTRAALQAHSSLSREIETCLREHPAISKLVQEVRAEPEDVVHMVSPAQVRERLPRVGRSEKVGVPQALEVA
jgi:hypothetical protein